MKVHNEKCLSCGCDDFVAIQRKGDRKYNVGLYCYKCQTLLRKATKEEVKNIFKEA